jgi:hypothetical protein
MAIRVCHLGVPDQKPGHFSTTCAKPAGFLQLIDLF